MPLVQTRGAASAQGFGEFAQASVPNYIEEVFSTYLYTSTGSNQTITNGIDLSTKGGLVWVKSRNAIKDNVLVDTVRGVSNSIASNTTNQQDFSSGNYVNAFSTTGFGVGGIGDVGGTNNTFATWTFREQPKFFDVVTYTGDGVVRNIPHNLGSVPGSIIVKRTDSARDWAVYHRSLANTQYLVLNSTAAVATGANRWDSTTPTSTVFTVGANADVNTSGGTYVAYLFAHDAGGFGLTGLDNVISCGTFTTVSSGYSPNVELGYEPQWIMLKRTDSTGDWLIVDTMRGWVDPSGTGANDANLRPNLTDAENTNDIGWPYATGFNAGYRGGAESTWIYIAIRRGPMAVPTVGTSVFLATARTGNAALTTVTSGFATDVVFARRRDTLDNANESVFADKLRGSSTLSTNDTAAEYNGGATSGLNAYLNTGVRLGTNNSPIYAFNYNTLPYVLYQFQRAPSFMDEICWTGNGTSQTISHNLGVQPQLYITKNRGLVRNWQVGSTLIPNTNYLVLNTTAASVNGGGSSRWNDTYPTSSVLSVGNAGTNESGSNYVGYLFATCAGVSKVASYTGNGTTQTIDCGFGAGGARFVLIKRTDSTGDWYVYDTARGMTVLTDPYLLLNDTAAETATLGSVTTVSTGFALNSTILAAINVSAGTYIFLAIA